MSASVPSSLHTPRFHRNDVKIFCFYHGRRPVPPFYWVLSNTGVPFPPLGRVFIVVSDRLQKCLPCVESYSFCEAWCLDDHLTARAGCRAPLGALSPITSPVA